MLNTEVLFCSNENDWNAPVCPEKIRQLSFDPGSYSIEYSLRTSFGAGYSVNASLSFNVTAVSLPASSFLFLSGIGLLIMLKRKNKWI